MKKQVETHYSQDKEYKVGDWVFCEFKLQQVKEVMDGQVRSVSDGMFCQSSSTLNDRIFPMDMNVKVISDTVDHWRHLLHREGNGSLNYPDIHRWLVDKWCQICTNRDDKEKVESGLKEVEKFSMEILDKSKELNNISVGGIRLFRPKIRL